MEKSLRPDGAFGPKRPLGYVLKVFTYDRGGFVLEDWWFFLGAILFPEANCGGAVGPPRLEPP